MMYFRKNYFILCLIALLCSCTNSRVGSNGSSGSAGGGNSVNDVAFDPTKSTNLQIKPFKALRQQLMSVFSLTSGSDTITQLDANEASFMTKSYNSTYSKAYTSLVATLCGEYSANVFPDGLTVDHLWGKLTELKPDEDIKKMETEILAAASSSSSDIKEFGLCYGIMTSPSVMFVNFVKTSSGAGGAE
jgi:hypothetical protein